MTAKITVKTASQSYTLENVDLGITVLQFKELIAQQSSIPAAEQRLVFLGQVLVNEKSLRDCNVKDGVAMHLVKSTNVSAPAPPRPTPAPASNTAPSNLFSAQPAPRPQQGQRAGGMPGMPAGMPGNMMQMLSTPQGQQMMSQLMSNPDFLRQIMASNPALANNPEAMAMLSNPQFLQMMSNPQNLQQMFGGGEDVFPRDVFDVAIGVMNGNPIPEGYPTLQRAGGPSSPQQPQQSQSPPNPLQQQQHREYVTREQLQQALQAAMGGQTQAPPPQTSVPTTTPAPPSVPTQPTPPQGQGLAQRYASQLEVLRGMGFTNDAASLQALEAAGGDVQFALSFLTD